MLKTDPLIARFHSLYIKLVLPFSLVILFTFSKGEVVHASHIFGAEITYECLNDTDIRIHFKGYRDCLGGAPSIGVQFMFTHVSGPMDEPVALGPYSQQVIREIPFTCPAQSTGCTVPNSAVNGVEEYTSYRDYSFLPGSVWKVAFSSCCRNSALTNGAAFSGIYIEALIDNTTTPCNSSPQFIHEVKFQSCVNEMVTYSVNAVDPDGDSLKYSLVDCYSSIGVPVPYVAGLSGSNPMTTKPGMEWSINQYSGEVTGFPSVEQYGTICILIEEFRNGMKIGEIARDLNYYVTNCSNTSPQIAGPFNYSVTAGQELCFDILASDVDPGDILNINNLSPFGGQIVNTVGINPITATYCWTPALDDVGINYIPIEVIDDACPYLGTNTHVYQIMVAPPPVKEIYEIQGSGFTSPYDMMIVTTENNVVTALSADGFFMQTPAARSDFDAGTSDGIFVFTNTPPTVVVGDLVNVTGQVEEFFGFTQFAGGSIADVVGSEVIPPYVLLNALKPSPDPTSLSCGISNFECLEGMLVEISEGTVTGPNQRFSPDPISAVHIVAGTQRTFIEPGITYPGLPGLPVWDGNPEVFELDPDRLGQPNQIIPAGSSFQAQGVMGFEFGGYELWPTSLTFTPAILPVNVRPRNEGEATIATLELFKLFDDVDDPPSTDSQGNTRDDFEVVSTAEYQRRLSKLTRYIVSVLDAPDILAVQEAEKIEVLADLAANISILNPAVNYTPYLIEGNDILTLDVGFLVRETVDVTAVTQLGKDETFVNPENNNLNILHDRPPLLLEGIFKDSGIPVGVLGVHIRSWSDIESSDRVKVKRLSQAQSVAQIIQDYQTSKSPYAYLAVLGDFNASEFTDGYVDVMGQISGIVDPSQNLFSGPDLVSPNLFNEVYLLPSEERYSCIFRGNGKAVDHILTTPRLHSVVTDVAYGRGNADAAVDYINDDTVLLRSSDHDGMVVYLDLTMASIPTLSQWGIFVLSLILIIFGISYIKMLNRKNIFIN